MLRSLDPLEIYICKEGLARFSTVPYKKPTVKNIQESFMHLTNYSLNKRSADFDRSENEDEGSKGKLTSVFKQMEQDGYDSEEVMAEIERVVCKTIIAIIPELKTEWWAAFPHGRKGSPCFQVRSWLTISCRALQYLDVPKIQINFLLLPGTHAIVR